ncbi:MAG TPA: MlaD family protein [Solirubrobacteraceae bacterium]|jgi:virulence factor Mce-like protein|nr:MlaD family protein [Solirubrobacteraceae bacterium]
MRRNQKRQLSTFAVGAIVLALIVMLTYLGFTKAIPFQHHYTIQAAFRSANNLKKGSFVRIAGVNVGKVTGVHSVITPGGQPGALVTMRIDTSGLPIHRDAQAAIRPRIFLEGNFFVDLKPGTPAAPTMSDGDTIPIQNNTSPVQLDQILSLLQADTRKNLQTLISEYAKGLEGPGAAGFNASIKYWPKAYRDNAIVNDATIGQNPHDLSGYLKGAAGTAEGLDRNPQALQSLLTDFNTTAHAFSVQQTALEQTVAELPRTLHAAQPALASLNNAFPPVRRLAVDFLPGVRSSGPALDASLPFVRQLRGLVSRAELRGLVADLRPTVPALAMLNNVTPAFLAENRAFSSCQNSVVLPWTKLTVPDPNFPATGPVFQEAPKPLVGLAGESRTGDANGLWYRVLLNAGNYTYNLGNNRFVQTAFPFLGANPPKAQVRPPLRPDVPCETQKVPNLQTVVGPPPPQAKTDPSSPATQSLYNWARKGAVQLLRDELKAHGQRTPVSNQDITAAQIAQLAAKYGNSAALSQVPNLMRSARAGK